MVGFCKQMEGLDAEGKQSFASRNMEDEDGKLLRDPALILKRWARWFHKLFNTKSPTLDPRMAEQVKQGHKCVPLDDISSRFEVEEAIRGVVNRKTARRTSCQR
ncbi:unnamed protein product, partial [Sphacelaria rigidula]